MTSVTICSDFGAPKIKSLTVSIVLLLANRILKKNYIYTLANHFEKILHCLEKLKYMTFQQFYLQMHTCVHVHLEMCERLHGNIVYNNNNIQETKVNLWKIG